MRKELGLGAKTSQPRNGPGILLQFSLHEHCKQMGDLALTGRSICHMSKICKKTKTKNKQQQQQKSFSVHMIENFFLKSFRFPYLKN